MTGGGPKPPVSIDLGASASLNVEVKAEVPPGSMGRLVDALTDAIRPFTEARGLRADQIRLQREDVLLKIARRAQERLTVEGREPKAIPTKTIVPLLEKASLEDPNDEEMIERWATLLAAESSDPNLSRRWCIDILASLDSSEAQTLDEIFNRQTLRSAFDVENYTRAAAEDEFEHILMECSHTPEEDLRATLGKYDGVTIVFWGANIPNTNEFYLQDFPEGIALLHLQTLGLIWLNASSFVSGVDRNFVLNAKLSPLGFEFVTACRGSERDV